MAKPETHKAAVNLKAESLAALISSLEQIALDAGMQIVMSASITTSIALEAEDLDDLSLAIGDIAGAVGRSDGVECKVSAPGSVWDRRRLDSTPMERYIDQMEV